MSEILEPLIDNSIIGKLRKYSSVTFDEAVVSAGPLLAHLKRESDRISRYYRTNPIPHGLPHAYACVMRFYTAEYVTEPAESFYSILNRLLRKKDRGELKPFFQLLSLLLCAFEALPKVDSGLAGVVRGTRGNLTVYYPAEREGTWWGLSSVTTAVDVAESFIKMDGPINAENPATFFHILGFHNGCDITPFSYFPKEKEILLPAGIEFRVLSTTNPTPGFFIITIQAIHPVETLIFLD